MKPLIPAAFAAVWLAVLIGLSHMVAHSLIPGVVVGLTTVVGAIIWAGRL